MPEISDLLERTTPRRPPAFDVGDLVQRGRRRRRRTQVGTGIAGVALVASAMAGLGLVGSQQDEPLVVASRPPIGAVAEAFAAAEEPLGTWEQLPDPPFSPRMGAFTGTTSDGRVVMWGGSDSIEGAGWNLTDGGMYDPEGGTWDVIPPAPVPAGWQFHPDQVQLAKDRLMVLGSPNGFGPVAVAVFDLDAGAWTVIQPPPSIELPVEGVAWTGEMLALVRFWSGASVDKEASYVEPVVERWSYETGAWEAGSAPPLSNRFGPLVAFDGERLGVWGGARQDVVLGAPATGSEYTGDGAVYDVAADRWEAMAPAPISARMQGTALWRDGGFMVAGGVVEGSADSPAASEVTGRVEAVYDGAIYDLDERQWSAVPSPLGSAVPDERIQLGTHSFEVGEPGASALLTFDGPLHSGPHPVRFYDPVTRSWLEAPLRDLRTIDGTLIATSRTPDNPGNEPFEVQVLAGGVWEAATEAPFVNRMDAGVAVTGDDLLVVGGAEGPDLDITGHAWLLRFGD